MISSMDENNPVERVSSGSPEVNKILLGGFPKNSINIIMGNPGTGKTIFAEQLMFRNAGSDRPVLYLTTLAEPARKMLRYLQTFTFFDRAKLGTEVLYEDLGGAISKDGFAALNKRVEEVIREQSPKIIVIDSFKALHDLSPSISDLRRDLHDLTNGYSLRHNSVSDW